MQQSASWGAARFSAGQEISRILWTQKVHYRSLKCPPAVPILRQLDPVHTLTSHFLEIHFNIIIPYTPGSPKWSLSLRFPHQTPSYASPSTYALHVPSISFFPILSLAQYWVSSTDHNASHYVVFSASLSPRSFKAQIFSSTPFSKISPLYVYPPNDRPSFTPIQRRGIMIVL